jgi:toluene monooxygenase system protein E
MRQPPPLRTYSHLADKGQVPSEYQIVSSRLLYHPQRGFETDVPLAPWYRRHLSQGQLQCADWEAFADPRETTYSKYTALQARNEQHLNTLGLSVEASGQDAKLAPAYLALIDGALPPLRFAWHGFQMMAAYVGQMAPSGRITLVALFQAGDEMRRIQRIAQRMGQLQQRQPAFGAQARAHWQEHPAWQPLRRAIEHALVAYDWGESFVALNLCLKPFLDELLLGQFAGTARQRGDYFLGEILGSLAEDARWHRAWTAQLVALLLAESGAALAPPVSSDPGTGSEVPRLGNRAALAAWLTRWLPEARSAARAVATLLDDHEGRGASQTSAHDEGQALAARCETTVMAWLSGLGLVAI